MSSVASAVAIFIFLVGLVGIAIATHFKKSYLWVVAAVPFGFGIAFCISKSVTPWDAMFFMFWLNIGVMLVCILMTLQTRNMEKQEEEEVEAEYAEVDDVDNYVSEAEQYGDKQEKFEKATSRRARSRR